MAEFNFSFAMNVERNALGKQIQRNEILGKCIFKFLAQNNSSCQFNQRIKRNEREGEEKKSGEIELDETKEQLP